MKIQFEKESATFGDFWLIYFQIECINHVTENIIKDMNESGLGYSSVASSFWKGYQSALDDIAKNIFKIKNMKKLKDDFEFKYETTLKLRELHSKEKEEHICFVIKGICYDIDELIALEGLSRLEV
jgi:hypothetical protein